VGVVSTPSGKRLHEGMLTTRPVLPTTAVEVILRWVIIQTQ
jgi:hypothetical protein